MNAVNNSKVPGVRKETDKHGIELLQDPSLNKSRTVKKFNRSVSHDLLSPACLLSTRVLQKVTA